MLPDWGALGLPDLGSWHRADKEVKTDAQQLVSKLALLLPVNVHSQMGEPAVKTGRPSSFLLPALLFSLQGSGLPLVIVALSLD